MTCGSSLSHTLLRINRFVEIHLKPKGKIAGSEWKSMAAEAKAKYDKLAAADKERYAKEMKNYTPPAGSDDKKNAKGKTKAKKDPNAPKKAMSAFMYFSNKMRPKIKAENPAFSFGDLGKRIGELYRALTPSEKEPYEKMAAGDKKRFEKAKAAYESIKKGEDDGVDDADSDDGDDDSD